MGFFNGQWRNLRFNCHAWGILFAFFLVITSDVFAYTYDAWLKDGSSFFPRSQADSKCKEYAMQLAPNVNPPVYTLNDNYVNPGQMRCSAYGYGVTYAPVCTGFSGAPAAGTLNPNGLTCTTSQPCPQGQVQNQSGYCETPNPCQAGAPPPSSGIEYSEGSSPSGCYNGCQFKIDSTLTVCVSKKCYSGLGPGTGQSCSGNNVTPAPTTEYDCARKGMASGQVNGRTMCVPPSTNNPVKTTNRTTVTDKDGNVTSTDDTTVVNDGKTVTTTTTKTGTGSGGGTGGKGTGHQY